MEKLKQYVLNNFEQAFVLVILATVFIINYYIPQKIAFLNFYFLPVILAGYFLSARHSIMGSVLCIVMVTVYIYFYPDSFLTDRTRLDLYLHLMVWAGFLILSGAVVGKLQEKLRSEIAETCDLNDQLTAQQDELDAANTSLREYNEDLEEMVRKRTDELEKSREAVEKLKGKVEEALYSTMDSMVVKLMIEGRLRNEKRKVSVMFSDLVGFTSYSEERSPELLVRDLNRYLSDMEPIMMAYHGHIDKYLGDGIMCEFGAPIDYENYRLLAVLAGLKMQQKLATAGYPWRMRIGVASGTSIVGLVGSRRQSYTTIGDVVNLASRLEKSCPPGGVLVDSFTLEGIRPFVEYRLKTDFNGKERADGAIESEFEDLLGGLASAETDTAKAGLLQQLGRLYSSVGDYGEAVSCFEKGLTADSDDVEMKVAFAEAAMMKSEARKINVRGRKQRVAAYEILGIRDALLDREKIPAGFYEQFAQAVDLIEIPDDVILPVEALDGCIGHSRVVAVLSYAVAAEMGLPGGEKTEILHAGFVADIGKEIVPHHLLNRSPGSLSDTEIREIQKHPVEGPNILKKMGYDSDPLHRIVRHSHEHVNGAGHPDGLAGDAIPLGARIVAAADAYDALTSWRPYSEKWDRKAAFDELRRGVERGALDADVVETLIRLLG